MRLEGSRSLRFPCNDANQSAERQVGCSLALPLSRAGYALNRQPTRSDHIKLISFAGIWWMRLHHAACFKQTESCGPIDELTAGCVLILLTRRSSSTYLQSASLKDAVEDATNGSSVKYVSVCVVSLLSSFREHSTQLQFGDYSCILRLFLL